MKRNYLFVMAITVLVLVSLAIILIANRRTEIVDKNTLTQSQKPLKSLPDKELTIKLDKNGFDPKIATVSTGTAVHWNNTSGDKQTVNSDDYPTNKLHKELNFGVFNNGSTVTYIFTKLGSFGYHNQFHPEQKGIIYVTE